MLPNRENFAQIVKGLFRPNLQNSDLREKVRGVFAHGQAHYETPVNADTLQNMILQGNQKRQQQTFSPSGVDSVFDGLAKVVRNSADGTTNGVKTIINHNPILSVHYNAGEYTVGRTKQSTIMSQKDLGQSTALKRPVIDYMQTAYPNRSTSPNVVTFENNPKNSKKDWEEFVNQIRDYAQAPNRQLFWRE